MTSNPSCKIILCTSPRGWIYAPNGFVTNVYLDHPTEGTYEVTEKWANALISLGKFYGIPVVDWYNECGFNILNRHIFMNDPEPIDIPGGTNRLYSLHPTLDGYKRMADLLINKIKNLY